MGFRYEDLTDQDQDRFWSKQDVDTEIECWEWYGYKDRGGYGQIRVAGSVYRAHRVAWVIANEREIPDGMLVLHRCDNPGCVNPWHLWLGTHADNMRDKAVKGRVTGENNPRSKLTGAQVQLIREVAPLTTQVLISEVYGVSRVQVSRIVNGERWASIDR